jgi:hypothetical protein
MTPRRFAFLFLFAALCAGCASGGATDWYAIGARDGRLGAFPQDDYMQSRFSTPADRAQYLRGWDAGYRGVAISIPRNRVGETPG